MAIELQLSSVVALVTSEPRERQIYEGRGDDRKARGRFTDGEGRRSGRFPDGCMRSSCGCSPPTRSRPPWTRCRSTRTR